MTNIAYEPGKKDCSFCHGMGMIRLPNGTDSKQCICAFTEALKKRLGEELATSRPNLDKSPLYEVPKGGGEPLVDRTSENLFIKCWWKDFKPHFKLTAIHILEKRSFQWYWQIITDERIKSIFVGNEAYNARARKKRDDLITINSLADVMGKDYDLAIIRLGFLGYKNIAMAGALKEALLIRQSANKPTWILEEPCSIFGPGHHSWSLDLEEYLNSNYQVVDMVENHEGMNIEPRGVEGASISLTSDVSGMSLEDVRPKVKMPKPRFEVQEAAAKASTQSSLDTLMNNPVLMGKPKFKKKGGNF